jgi:hypothetical protein
MTRAEIGLRRIENGNVPVAAAAQLMREFDLHEAAIPY